MKCSEIQKNPWYDMARLDTIVEARLKKYEEEWEFLIQYDSESNKFLKCYFGLFREFVGYNSKSEGVKFRPYDGKVRPKTWDEFEKQTIYWNTLEEFIIGISNSQIYRWKSNISQHLVPILNEAQKQEFIDIFQGKAEIVIEADNDDDSDE